MPILNRGELSDLYLQELAELVSSGELGRAAAREIMNDLFDPGEPGRPRLVSEETWRSYVEEQATMAEIAAARSPRFI